MPPGYSTVTGADGKTYILGPDGLVTGSDGQFIGFDDAQAATEYLASNPPAGATTKSLTAEQKAGLAAGILDATDVPNADPLEVDAVRRGLGLTQSEIDLANSWAQNPPEGFTSKQRPVNFQEPPAPHVAPAGDYSTYTYNIPGTSIDGKLELNSVTGEVQAYNPATGQWQTISDGIITGPEGSPYGDQKNRFSLEFADGADGTTQVFLRDIHGDRIPVTDAIQQNLGIANGQLAGTAVDTRTPQQKAADAQDAALAAANGAVDQYLQANNIARGAPSEGQTSRAFDQGPGKVRVYDYAQGRIYEATWNPQTGRMDVTAAVPDDQTRAAGLALGIAQDASGNTTSGVATPGTRDLSSGFAYNPLEATRAALSGQGAASRYENTNFGSVLGARGQESFFGFAPVPGSVEAQQFRTQRAVANATGNTARGPGIGQGQLTVDSAGNVIFPSDSGGLSNLSFLANDIASGRPVRTAGGWWDPVTGTTVPNLPGQDRPFWQLTQAEEDALLRGDQYGFDSGTGNLTQTWSSGAGTTPDVRQVTNQNEIFANSGQAGPSPSYTEGVDYQIVQQPDGTYALMLPSGRTLSRRYSTAMAARLGANLDLYRNEWSTPMPTTQQQLTQRTVQSRASRTAALPISTSRHGDIGVNPAPIFKPTPEPVPPPPGTAPAPETPQTQVLPRTYVGAPVYQAMGGVDYAGGGGPAGANSFQTSNPVGMFELDPRTMQPLPGRGPRAIAGEDATGNGRPNPETISVQPNDVMLGREMGGGGGQHNFFNFNKGQATPIDTTSEILDAVLRRTRRRPLAVSLGG